MNWPGEEDTAVREQQEIRRISDALAVEQAHYWTVAAQKSTEQLRLASWELRKANDRAIAEAVTIGRTLERNELAPEFHERGAAAYAARQYANSVGSSGTDREGPRPQLSIRQRLFQGLGIHVEPKAKEGRS